MPTYYVDECKFIEEKPGKYGPLNIYDLTLKNTEGTFSAQIGQSTKTPAPSGTIEGAIEQTDYGPRFKRAAKQTSFAAAAGKTEYTSGRTPEERNSIVRQHSQHMAVMWVVTQQKKHPDLDLNYEYLKGVIDWFMEDARA